MRGNAKTSLATAALILLGIFALLAGEKSLTVLIPAAVLVWYGVNPHSRRSRRN
ncbi:MAG TPA: hypothetical protein VMS18_04260 [Candidatus Binatia bacterium]|nr:hypothetical protein [Candidatus Binatia bacterium]